MNIGQSIHRLLLTNWFDYCPEKTQTYTNKHCIIDLTNASSTKQRFVYIITWHVAPFAPMSHKFVLFLEWQSSNLIHFYDNDICQQFFRLHIDFCQLYITYSIKKYLSYYRSSSNRYYIWRQPRNARTVANTISCIVCVLEKFTLCNYARIYGYVTTRLSVMLHTSRVVLRYGLFRWNYV